MNNPDTKTPNSSGSNILTLVYAVVVIHFVVLPFIG